jgi:hypothetical protein
LACRRSCLITVSSVCCICPMSSFCSVVFSWAVYDTPLTISSEFSR